MLSKLALIGKTVTNLTKSEKGRISMIEYVCHDCNELELHTEIIPKKKCKSCGFYMEAVESEDE